MARFPGRKNLATFLVMKFLAVSLSVVLLTAIANGPASAEVYTWVDANGVSHYSSKPVKNAKPAKLPPITKEKFASKVPSVLSCAKHGGVNCNAGTDTDGSVICFDGFREATLRFRFTCTAAKLEVTQVSNPDDKGNFKVFLRNSRSVEATGVKVALTLEDGSRVSLRGPQNVEGFGVGEFSYHGKKVPFIPDAGHIDVACTTCP